MGGKGKLKGVKPDSGKKLKVSEDTTPKFDIKHPVFCLRYLHRDYGVEQCTDGEKAALISRMTKLSQLTWLQIQFADKHGFGSEKINQNSIKLGVPTTVTKDQDFLALRFDGVKAMIGYRNDFIFHICYLDRDFTVYSH